MTKAKDQSPKSIVSRTKPAAWKNRIVGHGEKPADEFVFNPLNYRRHPEEQREGVRQILGLVGWVTEVIENVQTGNLIDGQARIEEALKQEPKQLIPYTKVDLSPAEEKLILATLDPLTGLAETDPDTLQLLIDETLEEMPDLDELLQSLHNEEPAEPPKERSVQFTEHFRIVIECRNRTQQKRVAKRIESEFESEQLEVKAT